jgi:tetratricopeptide (TPR) repeat protein
MSRARKRTTVLFWEGSLCFLLWMSGCSCPRKETSPTFLEQALFQLGEEARTGLGLELDTLGVSQKKMEDLIQIVLHEMDESSPKAATDLARLLFEKAGIDRDVEDDRPELALPSGVLSRRRGSCLGLSGLYLALSRRLGWKSHLTLAPGHAFVRVERGGKVENVELLRRGEVMPDSWYQEKYRPPTTGHAYMRALNDEEALAVFRYNLSSAWADSGFFQTALQEYQDVLEILPELAEARAGAGWLLERMGRSSEAEAQYELALKDNPTILGVRQNLTRIRSLLESRRDRDKRIAPPVDFSKKELDKE